MRIDITAAAQGVWTLADGRRMPDAQGVLAQVELALPAAQSICHYAAFQRHDPLQQGRAASIGGGMNRVQGLRIAGWAEAIEGGVLALLALPEGDWLALLPLAGRETLAWLAPDGARLTVKVGPLGPAAVDGEIPVLAWARRPTVYAACADVWELALLHPLMRGLGRLRDEKRYPEMLQYLGWCSWEQYKREINEPVLCEAVRRIGASGLPIRFVLVDDGHLRQAKGQLLEFGPDPEKFPQGWAPLLAQRSAEHVRWFGLWLNFNGYWGRIAAENGLDAGLKDHLMPVPAGGCLPKPTLPAAVAWYEAMVGVARAAGFDFVKVDDQAQALPGYRGIANPVQAAALCSQALERAAAAQVGGLINCMAHGPINAFNTSLSAVTRCSEDYQVDNAWRAKAHLHNSYQNMLWLGPTVWGDHDMFHSCDRFAGAIMAVSKAVSGGPVYLSDDPAAFNPGLVRPLCFGDGRLLRPLAPAAPLPRSVILDPFEQAEPYLVAAPLLNGAAAVVAYNLTEPTQAVSGEIRADDHRDAAGLLRGAWGEADEGLVLYDWFARAAVALAAPWAFTLPAFGHRFVLLCPIRQGWAVIGRADKYLAPAGVRVIDVTRAEVVVDTPEAGPVSVWRAGRLWAVDLPAGRHRITA